MAGKKYYDNDNLTDYSPYGYNPKTGNQYRADGSPINYAGTGDNYRRKGGSQEGYNSKGNAENRSYRDSVSDYGGWSDKGSWSPDGWGYSDDYVRRAYGGSGGDPYYTGRGGSGGGSSYSWNRNPYADALAAANAAQQAALEQGRTALNAQKTGVNQSFDDLAKQAYTNYMVNDKKMRQQTGTLATGTADSLALQGQLGYENRLSANERERQNTLTGIDNDILSLEQQAQQNIAANEEKYALMTEEYNQQMEQQAYERALAEKQAALDQAELERQIQQQELENSWRERELAIQEGNANRSRSSGGSGGGQTVDIGNLFKQYDRQLEAGDTAGAMKTMRMIQQLNGTLEEDENPSVDAGTAEKLSRWYNALSAEEFDRRMAAEIENGILTEAQAYQWLASKGLLDNEYDQNGRLVRGGTR